MYNTTYLNNTILEQNLTEGMKLSFPSKISSYYHLIIIIVMCFFKSTEILDFVPESVHFSCWIQNLLISVVCVDFHAF